MQSQEQLYKYCYPEMIKICCRYAGDLDKVKNAVKVTCFVASTPDFYGQPQVANGASELVGEVFGDAGRHARSAVGVPVLPLDSPVEVEMVVEVG